MEKSRRRYYKPQSWICGVGGGGGVRLGGPNKGPLRPSSL